MNTQDRQNWEQKLQDLEVEVNQSSGSTPDPTPAGQDSSLQQQLQKIVAQIKNWFNTLPHIGKVAVALLGIVVGFSLLKTLLELVSALVSIALVGGLLYWVYTKAIAPPQS